MARTNATNFSGPLQFPYATAATDLFKKEDVQTLALAVDGHDHSSGKGLALAAGSIGTGVITSAMIADGTIATADLADGSVTTAKHADASVTNAKLASDTARANLLTNGGVEMWQRGNGPFSANGAFTADRWSIALGGTSTMSVSKETTNVDNSPAAAACTYVHNSTSWFVHVLENYAQLKGKTVTLSIRVRAATASAVRIALYDGVTSTPSSYHTGGGAYETLTVTVVISASATQVSPRIEFNASCTAYVDNAMLVVGSVAADYAPLHPADELARCLRYYEVIGANVGGSSTGTAGTYFGSGLNIAVGQAWIPVRYRSPKPVTPSVTFNGPSNYNVVYGSGGTSACGSIGGINTAGDATGIIAGSVVGNPLTVGSTCLLQATTVSGVMFVEANP